MNGKTLFATGFLIPSKLCLCLPIYETRQHIPENIMNPNLITNYTNQTEWKKKIYCIFEPNQNAFDYMIACTTCNCKCEHSHTNKVSWDERKRARERENDCWIGQWDIDREILFRIVTPYTLWLFCYDTQFAHSLPTSTCYDYFSDMMSKDVDGKFPSCKTRWKYDEFNFVA